MTHEDNCNIFGKALHVPPFDLSHSECNCHLAAMVSPQDKHRKDNVAAKLQTQDQCLPPLSTQVVYNPTMLVANNSCKTNRDDVGGGICVFNESQPKQRFDWSESNRWGPNPSSWNENDKVKALSTSVQLCGLRHQNLAYLHVHVHVL